MDVNPAMTTGDESPQCQFCALEYRPKGWHSESSGTAPVILLALRDEAGHVRVVVHPLLTSLVRKEDLVYLQSLLQDFLTRAEFDPGGLFNQLSSLGVGPLVTQAVGEDLRDYPTLQELASEFEPL